KLQRGPARGASPVDLVAEGAAEPATHLDHLPFDRVHYARHRCLRPGKPALRLGDRAGPRLRFENVKRRASAVQLEHQAWSGDPASTHRYVPQLVQRDIELDHGLA